MAYGNPVIDNITVDDFKSLFFRDFTYINTWSNLNTYQINDIIFYDSNNGFYKCLNSNVTSDPSLTPADWSKINGSTYITDKDILKAYQEAYIINASIYPTNEILKQAFLYLSAHFLVQDMKANGLNSTGYKQVTSVNVGSVSESYQIPQWMSNNPHWFFFTTTYYGVKYSILTRSYTVGTARIVYGATTSD